MSAVAKRKQAIAPVEGLIHIIRGQKVMLDEDLARLYKVETRALNQAVKRNLDRFPEDFMFQLTQAEETLMRSQLVTTSKKRLSYQSLVFTEHGVAMLSAVLRSPRALQASIMVMRAFVRMREVLATHKEIATKIEKLERNHENTASIIEVLVEDIDKLAKDIHWMKNPPVPKKYPMGFQIGKGTKS